MWPAEYFGQQHWVTLAEMNFAQLPPKEELTETIPHPAVHTPVLTEYRNASKHNYLNMTLRVISVVPRVFEITNFLSPAEVDHLHEMADTVKFRRSSTAGTLSPEEDDTKTRTSSNSWVYREHSPIVDAIFRRAAHLECIDEALMQRCKSHERPDVCDKKSYAEALQFGTCLYVLSGALCMVPGTWYLLVVTHAFSLVELAQYTVPWAMGIQGT